MGRIGVHPRILIEDSAHSFMLLENQEEPFTYKFFVPAGVVSAIVVLNIEEYCETCPHLIFLVAPEALPNSKNYLEMLDIPSNETQTVEVEFFCVEDVWHYIDLGFVKPDEVAGMSEESNQTTRANPNHLKYSISLKFVYENQTSEETNLPQVIYNTFPLLRQTYREFFMYDFDLLPDHNNETPAYVNITASNPVQLKVTIGDTYDIGGTLSFAVAFFTGSKADYGESLTIHHSQAVAEKLVDNPKQSKNVALIVCMRVGIAGIPTWPDKCIYGRLSYPPVIVINTTSEHSSTGLVHVPYPETGQWIISMGIFCDFVAAKNETQSVEVTNSEKNRLFIHENAHLLDEMVHPICDCSTRRKALKMCILDETRSCLYVQMNDSLVDEIKDCMLSSGCVKNYQSARKSYESFQHYYNAGRYFRSGSIMVDGEENCNTRLVFTIASNPCVAGR